MSVFTDVFRVLFLGYSVWLTILMIRKIGDMRMAIIDWPMGIVYGFVAFGFALMTWRAIGVGIQNWKRGASVLERPELMDEAK
jgi:TRAP-type C4-dicarboxylate transport system permease small subunit